MSDDKKEVTREEFIKQMTNFENVTAQKILEVLENEKHMLSVEVLGLISIARALINTFGDEYLLDTAITYLQFKEPEESNKNEEEE